MSEHMMPIPSRLYNAAVGGHVAGADQIIDDETGLTLDKVTGGALEEKEYTSGSNNGMGRVVLRKNLVEGVNTLVQTMINKSNTIYVIQYDFTLGEDITIPANCVLEFDGGSLSGAYTITGANTGISAGLVKIFDTDATLAGSWNVVEAYSEWFGVTVGTDCTNAINKSLQTFNKVVLRENTTYVVDGTISLNGGKCLRLNNRTIILRVSNNTDPIISITGFSNSLLGESKKSEIKSNSFTPYGLISMCDFKDTVSDVYCQMNKIDNIRISGPYPTAFPTDIPSIGLRFKHTQSGTGGYHNSITNMWFYYFNVGLKMAGEVNANYLRDLTFAYCGSSNFNTDSAILLEDATLTDSNVYAPSENQIINVFVTGTYNDTGGSCLCINGGIRYNTLIINGENGNNGRGMVVIGTESAQENIQKNIFITNFVQNLANSNTSLLYKNNTIIEQYNISTKNILSETSTVDSITSLSKTEIGGNYYNNFKIDKNSFAKEGFLNISKNLGTCFGENKAYNIFSYKLNGQSGRELAYISYRFITTENGYLNSFVEGNLIISKQDGSVISYKTPDIKDISVCKPIVSNGYLHIVIKMRTWTGSISSFGTGILQIEYLSKNTRDIRAINNFIIPDTDNVPEYSGAVELAYGKNIGTTSERPTYPSLGMNYFDTTVNKAIWYESNNVWVDATGTPV